MSEVSLQIKFSLLAKLWAIGFGIFFVLLTLLDSAFSKAPRLFFTVETALLLIIFLLVSLLLSLYLYWVMSFARVTITKDYVSGRTAKFKKIKLPTESITKVEMLRNPVASSFVFTSNTSNEKIVFPVMGMLGFKNHEKIIALLGPDHVISKWVLQHAI